MGREPAELSAARPPAADEERRVEELLRVNARLAAEIRDLSLGRSGAPRAGAMPVARRIATLTEERDRFAERLREAQRGVSEVNEAMDNARAEIAALAQGNAELAAALAELRSGPRGALRRVLARIGRRRSG